MLLSYLAHHLLILSGVNPLEILQLSMHHGLLLGVDPFKLFDGFFHFSHLLLDFQHLIVFPDNLFLLLLNDSLQVIQLGRVIVYPR